MSENYILLIINELKSKYFQIHLRRINIPSMQFKEMLHRIAEAPAYYYDAFYCPVKRATIQFAWSSLFLGFSWTLDEIGTILLFMAPIWGMICKLLAGLTLMGNFTMMVMTLAKRVRDWKKPEDQEGKIEKK